MSLKGISAKDSSYDHLWDYLTRAKNKDRIQIRSTPRLVGRPDFNIPMNYSGLVDIKVEKL